MSNMLRIVTNANKYAYCKTKETLCKTTCLPTFDNDHIINVWR
jgi:hypothetical protein